MKCVPGHTLSVLKPNSFVLKWKRVVSVLSPLASKSYGRSHISYVIYSFAVKPGKRNLHKIAIIFSAIRHSPPQNVQMTRYGISIKYFFLVFALK